MTNATPRTAGGFIMIRNTVLVVAMLIAASVQASAQDSLKTVLSPITATCGTWLSARRDKKIARYQMETWVLGFISGVNWASPGDNKDFLEGMDADAVWAWLDNYCRAHPLENLRESAIALTRELRTRAERR